MADDEKPAGGGRTMQVDAVADAAELLEALSADAAGATQIPDSMAPPPMAPPPLPPKKKKPPILVIGVVVAVAAAGLGLWVGGAMMGPAANPASEASAPTPATGTSVATAEAEPEEEPPPMIELGAIEVEASDSAGDAGPE